MQTLTTAPRVLEFAPPCKQLALIQIGVYIVSFALTWYRVWWDSIIGLVVALWGYYALADTNAPNPRHINHFYNGNCVSLASHVIALAVVLYYMLRGHLFNDVIGLEAIKTQVPGWVFFGFLLAMLGIEIIVTTVTIFRVTSLVAEISRNSVYADLTRGAGRA